MRQVHDPRPADADRLLWCLADATAGLSDRSLYRAIVSVLAGTVDATLVALTFRPDDAGVALAVHARPDGRTAIDPVHAIRGPVGTVLVDGVTHLSAGHLRPIHPLPGDRPAAEVRLFPIDDADGAPMGEIAVFFADRAPDARTLEAVAIFARLAAGDMRRTRTETELNRLATTDPLTGIANRRALMAAADREVRRSRRFRDPLSAMVVDLDHFKRINDRAGHAGGDDVLRRFAEGMTRTLRSIDVVGRIGGEEFAILLPGTALPGAMLTADRLRAMTRTIALPRGTDLEVLTLSVGVAELSPEDATAEAMLGRADVAMYRAKRGGRDRAVAADVAAPVTADGVS